MVVMALATACPACPALLLNTYNSLAACAGFPLSRSSSSSLVCLMRAETFSSIASELIPCECRSIHRASARMIWFSRMARWILSIICTVRSATSGKRRAPAERQRTTFSVRWYRRAALLAPCVVPDVVLRAPCVVPDVVLRAPRVVPDAVPCQTSASQWKAWRAWWATSGRQHLTPSELQARPQVQTQPRIQKEQERFDDRPALVPNVHPCQAPGLLPSCTSPKFQRVGIDLNQPSRGDKPVRALARVMVWPPATVIARPGPSKGVSNRRDRATAPIEDICHHAFRGLI